MDTLNQLTFKCERVNPLGVLEECFPHPALMANIFASLAAAQTGVLMQQQQGGIVEKSKSADDSTIKTD